ncbi:hypothetical protein F5B17DRAFT_451429 [Nemania serpens]|nr:hypothetical protein F5B17DRAFT_451429 [Nemania serpens]
MSPPPKTTRHALPTLESRRWHPQSKAESTTSLESGETEERNSPLLVETPSPKKTTSPPHDIAPPSQSPIPQPQPQPRPPRQRDHRAKTQYEKERGERLDNDFIGVDADTPCACCQKRLASRSKTHGPEAPRQRCRVPRNPRIFKSYKCGYCIGSKGRCSFSNENPGVKYEPESLQRTLPSEEAKRASRKKANETRRRQKEVARGGRTE